MKKKIILLLIAMVILLIIYVYDDLGNPLTNDFKSCKSEKYENTVFTSLFDEKIVPQKNLIYCSFFQNTLKNILSDSSLPKKYIELKSKFESSFNSDGEIPAITPKEYLISIYGKVNDQTVEKINSEVKSKVPKSNYELINSFLKNNSYILINYFEPILEFNENFETNYIRTDFMKHPVKCYGLELLSSEKKSFKNQLKILYDFRPDYIPDIMRQAKLKKIDVKFPKGFILKLVTKSDVEIIFSTLPPKSNLNNTFYEINNLINKKYDSYIQDATSENFIINEIYNVDYFKRGRILQIPEINFKVYQHSFESNNTDEVSISSLQFINFILSSKSKITKTQEDYSLLEKAINHLSRYDYLIDCPFIVFVRSKSKIPFLMAYICNDEVLTPINKIVK